ncbi:unnamed protein product [Psylliodes chrysocephalus]|uniref:Uncharacterized protein n=1 Tax=Psylliodes chrysocephalus TaxID=3402493 RepID=A0A9P0D7Z1_9CUCU|nr:unnamed protein product [Psylliodes chrysocephala]
MHKVPKLRTYENVLFKPYACVKCGGQHRTATCKKTLDTPDKCVLFEENHPASYKGCDVYNNLQKARRRPINQIPSQNNTQRNININDINQFPQINTHQPQINPQPIPQTSYAQRVTRNQSSDISEQ